VTVAQRRWAAGGTRQTSPSWRRSVVAGLGAATSSRTTTASKATGSTPSRSRKADSAYRWALAGVVTGVVLARRRGLPAGAARRRCRHPGGAGHQISATGSTKSCSVSATSVGLRIDAGRRPPATSTCDLPPDIPVRGAVEPGPRRCSCCTNDARWRRPDGSPRSSPGTDGAALGRSTRIGHHPPARLREHLGQPPRLGGAKPLSLRAPRDRQHQREV
jgi:hypothetical protein